MMVRTLGALALAACLSLTQSASADDPIPFYSPTPLTPRELQGKSLRELELMRAAIHARAGLVFLESWLYDHFRDAEWYAPGRYDESRLTEVDRKNLATLSQFTIPRDELRRRWNTLLARHRYAAEAQYDDIHFSADGRELSTLRTANGSRDLLTWDATTGAMVSRGAIAWPVPEGVRTKVLGPNGVARVSIERTPSRFLAHRVIGGELVTVTEYDVFIGSPRATHPQKKLLIGPNWTPSGREPGLAWACVAPDGSSALAYSSETKDASIFDLGAGVHAGSVPLPPSRDVLFRRCEYVDAKRAFIAGHFDSAPALLDLATKKLVPLGAPNGASVISANGSRLAVWPVSSSGDPGPISIYELGATLRQSKTLTGSRGGTARFSPDGARLLVGDPRGGLTLWDVASGTPKVLRAKAEHTYQWGADGCTSHGYELETHADAPEDLRGFRTRVVSKADAIAFTADGTRAAVVVAPGSLELWDLHAGRRVDAFLGHAPFTDEDLVEAKLLARRLGEKLDPLWRKGLPPRSPLAHLDALDQPLPPESLEPLSRPALRTLRNAICARHGCPLTSELLKSRFASWYEPRPDYSAALLREVDRANFRAIQAREAALGGPIAEAADRAGELGRGVETGFEVLPTPPSPRRVGFPPLR